MGAPNYLLAVMEAVSNSVETIQEQQLVDGQSTTLDTQIEQREYNSWTKKVSSAAQEVNKWAGKLAQSPNSPDADKWKTELANAQTNFQNMETEQQTFTQQADGGTQAMQNQVGQDSSNAQMKVQLEAAVNQVLQTITAALQNPL